MDVFDLQARLRLNTDEFKNGIDESKNLASKLKDGLGSGFGAVASTVKTTLETAAKAGTAALGAASTAVSAFAKSALNDYANYEQLVGGIETLFGESANRLLANADEAYRTAGMSVNEYMETSIQGAAALINSLDGDQQKAADLMDMSIIDMSDNVNKMGTTMEAVQNAYRGFSRQNFTMLDNLALGFAGTKEGMQELLDKAHEISGVEYDIESYSDIVQAIHVVQEEMGITGTTATEAADTISGSAGSVGAAWANLKIEIGKENGDIGKSFDILVNSISTSANNIIPRVKRILSGIGEAVTTLAPMISQAIPTVVGEILPDVLSSATTLVNALVAGIVDLLPAVGVAINESLPLIWQGLKDVSTTLWDKVVVPAWNFVTTKLPGLINDGFSKINLADVGTRIGNLIKAGLDGVSDFVKELDWGLIARQLTDCIMHIDWVGILKSVAGLIVNIVKQVPDIVGNVYHGIVDGITDLLSGDIGSISSEMEDAFSGAREETKNLHDELIDARNSMNEMRESAEELIWKEESQVEHTNKLWKELQTLVDENGKVKEGYENRAKFITGELSKATDTEIEMIDGQIAKYDELKASMDGLIQKKRASIMGNAYEDVYAAAIQQSASAGSSMRTIREQLTADETALTEYYNRFMNGAVQDIINAGITGKDVEKLKNLDLDEFRKSIGANNAVSREIEAYFSSDDYDKIKGIDNDYSSSLDNLRQLQKNQNEFNLIIEKYEKAQEAMMAEKYYDAEGYYRQIGDIQNGTFVDMEQGVDDYLEYIKTNLDDALVDYEDAIKAKAYGADEYLTNTIRGLIERGLSEGLTGAELLSTGVVEELSKIDHFDTSQLKSFMEQTGLELGDLAKKSVFTSLSSEWQSTITQMLYGTNNLIKPAIDENGNLRFNAIQSQADYEYYKSLGIAHADGGIFRKETHIFGEAGAEAVIPLSNDELGIRQIADALSRNMGGAGTVINVNLDGANISSDYDVDRLTDRVIEKISEGMESLRIRDSRGYGGVYA